MAAGLIGVQMGFGIVNVLDPREGQQVPLLSRLYDLIAVLLFLLMNGHHLLIRALGLSVRAMPLGGVQIGPGVAEQLLGLAGSIFVVALAVGAPLIAVLFLTDAAMGFVARTVPQMNIFIVGFPVKIALGMLGIALTLPFFVRTIDRLMSNLETDLLALLAGM
jgi:flagellar biosynthetic protein FliR